MKLAQTVYVNLKKFMYAFLQMGMSPEKIYMCYSKFQIKIHICAQLTLYNEL